MPKYQFQWPRIGHDGPTKILQRSIEGSTLAHAYLVYGPEAIGKINLVDTFVASLLCTAPVLRPCKSCESCRSLEKGIHPDLHVVAREEDSGSISVDQIRSLKRSIYLRSVSQGLKIATIHGAESMTTVAANALLKLLEEPPQGVVLVLIAHSLHSLPLTVLSRCQLVRCKPVAEAVIAEMLDILHVDPQLKQSIIGAALGRIRFARDIAADGGVQYEEQVRNAIALLESSLLDRLLLAPKLAQYDAQEHDENTAQQLPDDSREMRLGLLESILRDLMLIKSGVVLPTMSHYHQKASHLLSTMQLSDIYRLLIGVTDLRRGLATYAHAQLGWEYFFINS